MNKTAADNNCHWMDQADYEIARCLSLDNPQSFFLFAGAGSGKTRSLVNSLYYIQESFGDQLALRGQRIGVITYTNAACDEIKSRINYSPIFYVSTIHSFAWDLIKNFNHDIRSYLKEYLQSEVARLLQEEGKGRPGTKASIARQSQIASKKNRLERIDTIQIFVYNPTGENNTENSLNHADVIKICAKFLTEKNLMEQILIGRFPFLLIDESQDTNKHLMDAFLSIAIKYKTKFAIGIIGDTMQRIYADGKDNIQKSIPATWVKPTKQLNYRCPKRVVMLVNKIRSQVDNYIQTARTDADDGCVRLFICPSVATDKSKIEDNIRKLMAKYSNDDGWLERNSCKILTLEHHMAAKRLGFDRLFEPLSKIDAWRTGLLDGSLSILRIFIQIIIPLVEAYNDGDAFNIARIIRSNSPLLSQQALKNSPNAKEVLSCAQDCVHSLMSLWDKGEPTCGQVLRYVFESNIFIVPEMFKPALAIYCSSNAKDDIDSDSNDPVSQEVSALLSFFDTPFAQIDLYRRYISGLSSFDTHQGVKGLQFNRVMVIMDDTDTRGFMFSYEKLFGAKEISATDIKNAREGNDTGIDRTRRLFYVTCSRTMDSLALITYTNNPNVVMQYALDNNWFFENEINIIEST